MTVHLPEDILLEIIQSLSSDIQTLCSCAATSHAWARCSQPYIFRVVNLSGRPRPGSVYRNLSQVLEKNPSLADHTHELHVHIGYVKSQEEADVESYVNMGDPGFPPFLDSFNHLKEVSLILTSQSRNRGITRALMNSFSRIFGLERLRKVTLSGFLSFPISILDHATYVTDLQLYAFHIDTQDPSEPPPTSRSQPENSLRARIRTPISLSLKYCAPQTHQSLARLVRDQGGPFASHWIEELVLVPNYDGPVVDEIGPCRDLLQSVKASQSGESGLSRFTFKPANKDFRYAGFGSVLPTSITYLEVDFSGLWDSWSFWRHGDSLEYLIRGVGTLPPLREIQLRIGFGKLRTDTNTSSYVLQIDRLLASKELFPSFQKLCVVGILHAEGSVVGIGRATESCEQRLKRWFPTLNETGRIVVEWEGGLVGAHFEYQ